jgi:hypothetical protein
VAGMMAVSTAVIESIARRGDPSQPGPHAPSTVSARLVITISTGLSDDCNRFHLPQNGGIPGTSARETVQQEPLHEWIAPELSVTSNGEHQKTEECRIVVRCADRPKPVFEAHNCE